MVLSSKLKFLKPENGISRFRKTRLFLGRSFCLSGIKRMARPEWSGGEKSNAQRETPKVEIFAIAFDFNCGLYYIFLDNLTIFA